MNVLKKFYAQNCFLLMIERLQQFFKTLRLYLILATFLSVWKENNENPRIFMTGSCVSFFFVHKITSEVSFEALMVC